MWEKPQDNWATELTYDNRKIKQTQKLQELFEVGKR